MLAVLSVGVDADVPGILRPQQVHGIGDHDRAFVKMVFVFAVGFSNPVCRRCQRRNEILEIHDNPPREVD